MAQVGQIKPETMIETEEGQLFFAKNAKGLTFSEAASPETSLPAKETGIQVEMNNELVKVSKHILFALAAQDKIEPNTKIIFNGMETTADSVRGIVFGQPQSELNKSASVPSVPVLMTDSHKTMNSDLPPAITFSVVEQAEIDEFCRKFGSDVNAVDVHWSGWKNG